MPRLNRFLFGSWLVPNWFEPLSTKNGNIYFGAGYKDRWENIHRRKIELSHTKLRVEDQIFGSFKKAVLRWRLIPGSWSLKSDKQAIVIKNKSLHSLSIEIHSEIPITRAELSQGWESRYYLKKSKLPVFELEVRQPAELISEISWSI